MGVGYTSLADGSIGTATSSAETSTAATDSGGAVHEEVGVAVALTLGGGGVSSASVGFAEDTLVVGSSVTCCALRTATGSHAITSGIVGQGVVGTSAGFGDIVESRVGSATQTLGAGSSRTGVTRDVALDAVAGDRIDYIAGVAGTLAEVEGSKGFASGTRGGGACRTGETSLVAGSASQRS